DNGMPFHGSIVRGLDATDPTNIKVLGEAKLGGWVQDTRVVGSVLYAVSEDYGWQYGWGYLPGGGGIGYAGGGGVANGGAPVAGGTAGSGTVGSNTTGGSRGPDVVVSSVSFANNQIKQVASKTYSGYGGIFNVTPNSIMLAHQLPAT